MAFNVRDNFCSVIRHLLAVLKTQAYYNSIVGHLMIFVVEQNMLI